jgi:hypothetical protein
LGGRGKVAPYQTTHLRVPLPLKSKIEALIDDYRAVVVDGQSPSSPYLDNARRILANSRSRDRAIIRRAFAELLAISEDDLK